MRQFIYEQKSRRTRVPDLPYKSLDHAENKLARLTVNISNNLSVIIIISDNVYSLTVNRSGRPARTLLASYNVSARVVRGRCNDSISYTESSTISFTTVTAHIQARSLTAREK